MSILKHMRRGAESPFIRYAIWGTILVTMGGFGILGGQGSLKDTFKSDTVAHIGRASVSAPDFDRLVQRTIQQQHMTQNEAYAKGVPQQVMKELVDRHLFSLAVIDEGIRISDAEAAKAVRDVIAPGIQEGMTQKQALETLLRANGMSEQDFVSSIKTEKAAEQLLKIVASGAFVPAQLTNDALKFRNESRRGEYLRLTPAAAGAVKDPSEEELKSYYNARAADYTIPEYRTLSVIVLDKEAIGDTIKVSDDKIRQYYDDNIDNYKTAETRSIAQVVASDEASAKAVYEAAVKSKNLKAAATAGKGSYISPQSFTKETIPGELAKTAFDGAAGAVLPPVQSPLGWHVLYIDKVVPATEKSFESVKADIAKELAQDQAADALYDFSNKIDDEVAGGKTLTEVAKENHLTETVLEKIDAHGMDANGKKVGEKLPIIDKLVSTGFNLLKGAASQIIETPDHAFAIVGVKEIFPAEQKPFDKVRADLLARWMTDRRLQLLSDKAAKAVNRLKKGEAFSAIAAELGQSVQSTPLLIRNTDPAKSGIDSNLFDALFGLESTGDAASVNDRNSITILRLAERKEPGAPSAKDLNEMNAVLTRSLSGDLLQQYRVHLMEQYGVTVNTPRLTTMYLPKTAGPDSEE
jgi:peptidyl-prolyl cis-trans isomerase D